MINLTTWRRTLPT